MWYALVENSTGRLQSLTDQRIANPPDGSVVIEVGASMPDLGTLMWDEATRLFISRPSPVMFDRLDDLQADPDFAPVFNSLTTARKTAMRTALGRMFADYRMRQAGEPVPLFRG